MATEGQEIKDERLEATHEEGGDDEVRLLARPDGDPAANKELEFDARLFCLFFDFASRNLQHCLSINRMLKLTCSPLLGRNRGHEATGRRDGIRSRKATGNADHTRPAIGEPERG